MNTRRRPRAGFTVVELLVTISVVGALVALVTPAVQNSRSRMRDAEFKNHLHQVGIALQNHEDARGVFPTTHSYQHRLASFLENRHDVWICPADSRAGYAIDDDYSYLLNDGTRFRFYHRNGFAVQPIEDIGANGHRDARAKDITDGLSNTAAMSERLLVSGYNEASSEEELRADPIRFLWYVASRQPDEASLANECESFRLTPYPLTYKTSGTFAGMGYDHILPPNRIGCQNTPPLPMNAVGDHVSSLVTTTSQHGGYVNVLLCDGSVRPVADQVDRKAWQALGTRNGNETISLE